MPLTDWFWVTVLLKQDQQNISRELGTIVAGHYYYHRVQKTSPTRVQKTRILQMRFMQDKPTNSLNCTISDDKFHNIISQHDDTANHRSSYLR